jgi:hypothetical protein
MKLYELTDNYARLLEMVEAGEDVADTLEAITDAIEVKAENIAKVIRSIEAQAKVIGEEEKRLTDRRRSLENESGRIKQYLELELRRVGLDKVKGNIFTVAIQKNPPSCEVTDESLIPAEFMKMVTSIDRKGILDAIKSGQAVPGAEIKHSESLRIR